MSTIALLLVDDDEDYRVLVTSMLGEFSAPAYTIEWAASLADGRAALRRAPFDAILLDYRLSGEFGIEFLYMATRVGCDAPVIMLTGQRDRAVEEMSVRAGAADYLSKDDLKPILLDRAIRFAIDRRAHQAALLRLNGQLEARVSERTQALELANAALHEEVRVRQDAEDALRQANRRKDEFLATLAHELRNPLAPLLNGLELLKAQRLDDVLGPTVVMMEGQLRHMVRLLGDLLDVSRITHGLMTVQREPLVVEAAVDDAVALSRPLIESHHHTLQVARPSSRWLVMGDRVRLAQALANLLNNAARYTPDGGCIALSVERPAHGDVEIHVRDNGPGIRPDAVAQVFEPFVRGTHPASQHAGGLGIGLSLVKHVAEAHRGSVAVAASGHGIGTDMVVRLPLYGVGPDASPSPPAPSPLEPEPPAGEPRAEASPGLRILIVDDNRDSALTLGALLELAGHEVHACYDGESALEAAAAFDPDVAIVDITLPGISGHDVARRLRATGRGALLLVAMSGHGQEEDRQRSRRAGFDDHLVKPVELDVLRSLVDRQTRRKAREASTEPSGLHT